MQKFVDELLGNLDDQTEDDQVLIDDQIRDAALSRDACSVAELLNVRDQRDLEAAVKRVADVQNRLFEKESEREALGRELEHLQEPVRIAAKAYASALEILEQKRLDLVELQAKQGVIDLGLESRREEINELRKELNELMEELS